MKKLVGLLLMIVLLGMAGFISAVEKEELKAKVPQLLEQLKTTKGERKWHIIYDLGYSGDERAVEALIKIVEDENETFEYRSIAIKALQMNANDKEKVVQVLKKLLKNEKLKKVAVITMYKLGERDISLSILERYARAGHPEVLYEDKIDTSVIPHKSKREYYKEFNTKKILKELSNNNDELVRAKALYCLFDLDKKITPNKIDEILKSNNDQVRNIGKGILKEMGDEKSIKRLEEIKDQEIKAKLKRNN